MKHIKSDTHTYAQLTEYLRDMASRGDDTAKRLLIEITENEGAQ